MKMNTTRVAVITAVIILVIAGVLALLVINGNVVIVTKAKAISLIQDKYPEMRGYPSDGLPPRAILAEHDKRGWHIAFVQQGSGLPIMIATCYLVDRDKNIILTGEYHPTSIDRQSTISPITCQ